MPKTVSTTDTEQAELTGNVRKGVFRRQPDGQSKQSRDRREPYEAARIGAIAWGKNEQLSGDIIYGACERERQTKKADNR